jgi:hypothetical protein
MHHTARSSERVFIGGNMRKQSIQLQNEDGSHRQWLCRGEIDRMVESGECTRITRRKDPCPKYRMKSYPQASTSEPSKAALTRQDALVLASLRPGFIERLDDVKLSSMPAERIQRLQRLMGHQVIPFNAAVANAGE